MVIRPNQYDRFINLRWRIRICLFLIFFVLVAYGQVKNFTFIDYDDSVYVTENHHVQAGITVEGFLWAFKFNEQTFYSYWQPLTWLSHMLDVQLYGMKPGYHHLTNVFFHIANTLLLFLLFHTITGKLWQSTLVASLFALHPLNVESVVWVAERKNVLSTFFWMLTMLSYAWYVKQPVMYRYFLTILSFTLGLMTKPMLVTLPFILILLDFWPLKRFEIGKAHSFDHVMPKSSICCARLPLFFRLLSEKIPLLFLSVTSIYLSLSLVKNYHTTVSTDMVPFNLRIANALVSYVKYIVKMIWPLNLAVLYPFPSRMPVWQMIGAILFLAGVSFLVIRLMRTKPYLVFGWFWYLVTLIPVIGIVQAGIWPEMADRWAYVPSIGLFIMIAWGIADILNGWQHRGITLVVIVMVLPLALIGVTRKQISYWQNSITLFKHTLSITKNNIYVHNNIGVALEKQGQIEEAIQHYMIVLKSDPNYAHAHNNLGNALSALGRDREAIGHYREALRIYPRYAKAYFNLGNVLLRQGKLDEASGHYIEALKIDPWYAEVHNNLGSILAIQGRTVEAIGHFREALRIRPDYAEAQGNLEKNVLIGQEKNQEFLKLQEALVQSPEDFGLQLKLGKHYKAMGELEKALVYYQRALSIQPALVEALNDVGLIYALKGEYDRARSYFKESIDREPDVPEAYYFMSGTYARQNRVRESIDWLERAVAKGFNNWDLLKVDRNLENIRRTTYFQGLLKDR